MNILVIYQPGIPGIEYPQISVLSKELMDVFTRIPKTRWTRSANYSWHMVTTLHYLGDETFLRLTSILESPPTTEHYARPLVTLKRYCLH